jgi:membrane associated rhomboid family serine protease
MAVTLIIVNAAIFVLQSIIEFYKPDLFGGYMKLFALSTTGLASGFVWQLVTFQFMHSGLWHLVGNLIVIFFFGRAVEDTIGRNGFLKLYLSSGVIGGLFQTLLAVLIPTAFGGSVVGASAGGFGLVAAFAAMYPERQITLLLFFVLPVTIRARTLLWFAIGLAVFGIIVPAGHVADGAHLGGILAGLGYVYYFVRGNPWPFSRPSVQPPKAKRPQLVRTASPKKGIWMQSPKPAPTDDLPPAEFISREVDPILDKISAHGMHSLTERERRILEAARNKI